MYSFGSRVGYEVYAEQLASMLKGDRALLQDVLEGLFHIAKADKVLHSRELEFLGALSTKAQLDPGSLARPPVIPSALVGPVRLANDANCFALSEALNPNWASR
jgi:hypothetical protein